MGETTLSPEAILRVSCGPLQIRLVINCPRMVEAFLHSEFTRAMLPDYQVTEEEHPLHPFRLPPDDFFTVYLYRSTLTRFIDNTPREARFVFKEESPEDNKEVYFEVLFFLQAWFAHQFQSLYGIYLLKAAALSYHDQTFLFVGPAGSGKSTLLHACLQLLPATEEAVFYDGKVLVSDDLHLLGGGAGLAPRQLPLSSQPSLPSVPAQAPTEEGFRQIPLSSPPPLPHSCKQPHEPLPITGFVFPSVEVYAPSDVLAAENCPTFRSTGKLFEAASFYSCTTHYHLPFFVQPLPFLDTEALYRQRYDFAFRLARKPAWTCLGNPEAMAHYVFDLLQRGGLAAE